MPARPLPHSRKWSKRSRDLWRAWTDNPVSARWTDEHWLLARGLIEQVEDTSKLDHPRERRLQERDIRQQERRLGLVAPPAKEEPPPPEPAQPREVELRTPNLDLLWTGERCQDIHPPLDDVKGYPSLGALVCQHIERWLVFGPGSLRGRPARVSDEQLALLHAIYMIYPKGHALEGERVFSQTELVLRKSVAKSLLAGGWIATCELDPEAPVRFAGWDDNGQPIGTSVVDPSIVMLAFTHDQSQSISYNSALAVIKGSLAVDRFRVTDKFVMRADGTGRMEAVSGSPSARDGAVNTSLTLLDETHRLRGDRLSETIGVLQENRLKRSGSWVLCTTTAWREGEESYAEREDIRVHKDKPSGVFYFRRSADPQKYDLTTKTGMMAAVKEASPPEAWEWTEKRAVEERFAMVKDDADDLALFQRVWCNIPTPLTSAEDIPFTEELLASLKGAPPRLKPSTQIAIGLDKYVIAATTLEAPHCSWILARCKDADAVELVLRKIIGDRPRAFTTTRVTLELERFKPHAQKWAGDRDLNYKDRLHKIQPGREEYRVAARFIDVCRKGDVFLALDEETEQEFLQLRTVELPQRANTPEGEDPRVVLAHTAPGFSALAVSFESAMTCISDGLVKTNVVYFGN